MTFSYRTVFCSVIIKALVILTSTAVYCAVSDLLATSATQAQHTAIQEAEKELVDARKLAQLYVFGAGGSARDEDIRLFIRMFNGQIRSDRIRIEGDDVFIDCGSQTAPVIQLAMGDFQYLFSLFTTENLMQISSTGSYSLEHTLKILSVAVSILANPFSAKPEMELFRMNAATALKKSNIENFEFFECPEGILGATKISLRTILDIYTGMYRKLKYSVDQAYSADEQDDSLIVHDDWVLNDSKSFTVLLHLVRLCKITELNLRACRLGGPLSNESLPREAQDILAKCQITRLVPPLSKSFCLYLFLAPDGDIHIQNRIWHGLAEVGWFSRRGDWLRENEFSDIFGTPEVIFCRNLARPAIRPEDFSVLDLVLISGGASGEFPWNQMICLENAINLRALNVVSCRTMPALDFLKNMSKLEALRLDNVKLIELPGGILASLPRLSRLEISRTRLKELPPEIGQLKNLERLIITNNRLLALLPDTLSNCSKLVFLNLFNNRLQSLPSGLANLNYLNISNNENPKLLAMVTNYTSLRTLEAKNNLISILPANLGDLVNLRVLDLESNRLLGLPFGIAELNALSVLILSDNCLSTLPYSVVYLRYLHRLTLDYNQFQRVPCFVEDMRKENRFFSPHLLGNPLKSKDAFGDLGLGTLWEVFGDGIMSEAQYRQTITRGSN